MTAPQLNPMMRQYWELKSRYEGCLLFFRLGDFYEMFFDDAERASRLLGLTLTSRDGGGDVKAPMCGVPFHSAQQYIAKLLKLGEKIALCEQLEDPRRAKGLVRRDVVRVLTPGTVVEASLLEERRNNFLAAVIAEGDAAAVAALDLSTGEFVASSFGGPSAAAEARAELERLAPAELLVDPAAGPDLVPAGPHRTALDAAPPPAEARAALLRHFKTASLDAFGCEGAPIVQRAAAALLAYARGAQRGGLEHVDRLVTYEPGEALRLDPFTREALEVTDPRRPEDADATLLSVLDRTASAMGARALRQWLLRPLAQAGPILDRLDAVEWLCGRNEERAALRTGLGACADLERIGARLGGRSANARDLVAVRSTLERLRELRTPLGEAPGILAEARAGLADHPALHGLLRDALGDDPPSAITEGGMIRAGFHPEVDELRALASDGKALLLAMQEAERRSTGIDTLRIQYNSVFGYFIEVTKSKAAQAPGRYLRKQTLAGVERFVTPELKALEGRILGAQERLCALEHELFEGLREEAAAHAGALRRTAAELGRLDALASLAETAVRHGYVRPAIDAAGILDIRDGRHPVLERSRDTFVANDVRLVPWQEPVLLVTGPNMGGKSTYLRQNALIALMAHAGSFVPAREARIGVLDGIFCRIGASDRLARGQSTFMVEMTEVAHILHHATERSLLVFDEVGRGTSTYDGLSIAWAVVEHVARSLGAKTLFATHYFELTALAEELPAVRNCNVLVREWKHELVFLYKIVPGRADRSYGVQVARLAGVPGAVLARAREVMDRFERGRRAAADAADQLSLFGPLPDPVRKRLEEAEVETLTPLEGLTLLHELKQLLRAGAKDGGYSDA